MKKNAKVRRLMTAIATIIVLVLVVGGFSAMQTVSAQEPQPPKTVEVGGKKVLEGFDLGEFGGDDSGCTRTELGEIHIGEVVGSEGENCKLVVEWSLKNGEETVVAGVYAAEPHEWFYVPLAVSGQNDQVRLVGTIWYLPRGWNAHQYAFDIARDRDNRDGTDSYVGLSPTDSWVVWQADQLLAPLSGASAPAKAAAAVEPTARVIIVTATPTSIVIMVPPTPEPTPTSEPTPTLEPMPTPTEESEVAGPPAVAVLTQQGLAGATRVLGLTCLGMALMAAIVVAVILFFGRKRPEEVVAPTAPAPAAPVPTPTPAPPVEEEEIIIPEEVEAAEEPIVIEAEEVPEEAVGPTIPDWLRAEATVAEPAVPPGTCRECGAPNQMGVFCWECGATLRPAVRTVDLRPTPPLPATT